MAASKDLRGVSVKKALHKAEKANKNPNAKKAVNAKKTTSLKATAVKPARFNRGVAGVAVASTLAMMLPSAAASALQINQQNIVDSANVEQAKPVKKEKSVKTINTLKKTKTVNAVKTVEPENTNRTVNTQKESNADPNADTTTNANNSYVITPNENNLEAKDQQTADEQVQTEQNPKTTYNLRIHYIIDGDSSNHLAQSYELTIDQVKLDSLKEGNYEYIPLPKSSGYSLSAVGSSDKYQYYIKNADGTYSVDNNANAEAPRYLRLSKDLITNYATNKKSVLVNNDAAQNTPSQASSQTNTPSQSNPQTTTSSQTTPQTTPQTSQEPQPQTTQPQTPQSQNTQAPAAQQNANSSTQYYGELNINYTPKEVKYYVHHMLQDAKNRDKFTDYSAPNSKTITVKDENGQNTEIHVTEAAGKVGTTVKAVSINIPGYEPENNIVSSPISDSAEEKDKLVLNLRYYRKAYTVTYDSAGGTDVTAQKVYYNQGVPEVSEPTYRGHKFLGWQIVDSTSTNSKNPEKVDFKTFTMPNHDVKLRAMWDANKTTSYRVNVWVQKADLVDKDPNSLANYDFVGLVERTNVKTDSNVALDKMDDAGVANDTSKLNGESVDDYVENPELGLTKEELQGTKANKYKDGLIEKFNWMNDTHVTDLDGYDTENPDDPKNYTVNAKGERVYKDNFTRYFYVNKDLTKKFNSKEHYSVPGRKDLGKRSKSNLCANDLNNTLNLFYDRKEYELIFAKPVVTDIESFKNSAITKIDENGKKTIYCYAGGGECSDKYDGKDEDEHDTKINHKGYRVKVRYGQKLNDIWPKATEVDYGDDDFSLASLGWCVGYAGEYKYRDVPPYRLTKKEFADPEFRAVGNKFTLKISDNPSDPNAQQYELKDDQRLITSDTISRDKDLPYTVVIKKQSIASAKKR